jgi:hypothetical protein
MPAVRPDGIDDAPDTGAALIVVLLVSLLGAALGVAMLHVADAEVVGAAAQRDGAETLHAADLALEFSLDELSRVSDWTTALSGGSRSVFFDSTSQPVSAVAGPLDLTTMTAALQAETNVRLGSGPNVPRWRLFASGSLDQLTGSAGPPVGPYLVTWVADDEAETDGNSSIDANASIRVRSEARGRRGSRRIAEAVIARSVAPGVIRLVSWKEGR